MKKIIIIGGGIGGLTAALCLQHLGMDFEVYEQSPEFREVGAAISLWPNALRVYREIGILPEVLQNCGEFKHVYLKTPHGTILADTQPAYDLPAVCTHRADLHRALLQALPQERLHTLHRLNTVQTTPENKVQVTFENGKQITCDLLIGADGINSVVRQAILNDGPPIFRGYNVWRGVAEIPLSMGYGSETMGTGARFGIVPIRKGYYGWWASLNEPLHTPDAPEDARQKLLRLFGNWHEPIAALIQHTPVILKNGTFDRKPTRGWSKGNMVLLGDAALPTTPNLGQGACMAIEGAFILAKALHRYGLTAQALQRYETLHFPRTAEITRNSLNMGRMGQLENPVLVSLRNLLLRLTPSSLSMKMLDRYFGYDPTQVQV